MHIYIYIYIYISIHTYREREREREICEALNVAEVPERRHDLQGPMLHVRHRRRWPSLSLFIQRVV